MKLTIDALIQGCISLSLMLTISNCDRVTYAAQNKSALNSPAKADAINTSLTKSTEHEDLGFSVQELVAYLQLDRHPVRVLTIEIKEESFSIVLDEVKIFGSRNSDSYKVTDICVSGTSMEFSACVERVIRLTNAKHSDCSNRIVEQFTKDFNGKDIAEEWLEENETRYNFRRIMGVPTFYCVNSRAEGRALLKSQPG